MNTEVEKNNPEDFCDERYELETYTEFCSGCGKRIPSEKLTKFSEAEREKYFWQKEIFCDEGRSHFLQGTGGGSLAPPYCRYCGGVMI